MSQDKTRDKEFERGRSYCLKLLSKRARTEHEITLRLGEKGYSKSTVELLVTALKRKGLLCDARFADDWVQRRIEQSPRSRKFLASELKAKGVPESIVAESLTSADVPTEKELAISLMDKKSLHGLSEEKEKARLFRLLVGKGFDADLAEEVINEKYN